MSVVLRDSEDKMLRINAWDWVSFTILWSVCRPRLLNDEQLLEQLRFGGVELPAAEIEAIVGYLRE
jgi:hypothetical protein